ncbi:hypothetical protein N7E70_008635 [Aminobacter sp. NyZ550]|uniref:hypothetical protein n=1 Tax=Aminobacter TaxID=31988 RepID=UPI0021D5AC3E|nr:MULTISPECIES: hypothetical protein [Aminobacter]MDR7222260.1 hypothetical protein [Aminobacter aminovorans]WAX96896.1 hypothetical protein N7E70_008635 [Aminobacter sp. NyZ550]WMC96088.1 hypothetical protein RAR13_22370 [Aminobacter aminovorans]
MKSHDRRHREQNTVVAQPARAEDQSFRLLDIFEQLESGQITEEEAAERLSARRKRRQGTFGRIVEAIAS